MSLFDRIFTTFIVILYSFAFVLVAIVACLLPFAEAYTLKGVIAFCTLSLYCLMAWAAVYQTIWDY